MIKKIKNSILLINREIKIENIIIDDKNIELNNENKIITLKSNFIRIFLDEDLLEINFDDIELTIKYKEKELNDLIDSNRTNSKLNDIKNLLIIKNVIIFLYFLNNLTSIKEEFLIKLKFLKELDYYYFLKNNFINKDINKDKEIHDIIFNFKISILNDKEEINKVNKSFYNDNIFKEFKENNKNENYIYNKYLSKEEKINKNLNKFNQFNQIIPDFNNKNKTGELKFFYSVFYDYNLKTNDSKKLYESLIDSKYITLKNKYYKFQKLLKYNDKLVCFKNDDTDILKTNFKENEIVYKKSLK